jgi:mannosyltransferase
VTRREVWILGGAIAVGAVARFATLDLQSFHHDEAVMAGRVIQPGLWDTLDQVADSERSPPLYYLLSWAWSQPFGTGEVGLRSLSGVIGTLMIPAAFLAGRELLSIRAGLYAAAFVALNPLVVWYSQEARSYILAALFLTLSLAFLARSLERRDTRSLALWAVACALALCSHYFALFFVLPQAIWLLYSDPRSNRALAATGAIAAVAVALTPLAVAQQGEDRRDGFADLSLPGRVAEVGLDYSVGEDPDPLAASARVDAVQIVAGVGGALAVLGAAGLALRRGTERERRAWLLAAGVAAVGVGLPALAALVGLDFLKPRNAMAGVVPVLLATAAGFAIAGAPRWIPAAALSLCALYGGVVIAVNSTAEMQREDWRGVAELVGDAPETRLLAVPQNGDDPLLYYLGAERFIGPAARAGASVSEVIAVTTTPRVSPPAGFEVADRDTLPPTFTIWTLRAERPEVLSEGDLADVLGERGTTLVDG